VVVKSGGSFVKPSCMGRPSKAQFLAVEVMAKLVAKRAEESAERTDLPAHGGAGPDANAGIAKRIIAEKFRLPPPFPHAKRPSGQRTNLGSAHIVKGGCGTQKFDARLPDLIPRTFLHYRVDHLRQP